MNDLKKFREFQKGLLKTIIDKIFIISMIIPVIFVIAIVIFLGDIKEVCFSTINIAFFGINAFYLMVLIFSVYIGCVNTAAFFRLTRKKCHKSMMTYIVFMAFVATILQVIELGVALIFLKSIPKISFLMVIKYFFIVYMGFVFIQLLFGSFSLLGCKIGYKLVLIIIPVIFILFEFKYIKIINLINVISYYSNVLILGSISFLLFYINWILIEKLDIKI